MKALSISIIFIAAITCSASPNFIFMLSDDQDWAGLSVQMHPEKPGSKSATAQTRNIARLASEGIRFSAAYAPASVCSPTRVSLQTGRSPAALQWTKAAPTVTARDGFKMISPTLRKNIASEEVTLAELLKGLGYATAHYGKWHIGGGGPEAHGYDESDGDTGNGDAEPFKDPNPVDIFGMGERAKAFMKKHVAVKKPFYIQLSYHALHYPQNASAAAAQTYGIDISKPAIKSAARSYPQATWIVANLKRTIPLQEACMDAVLNVMSPRNPQEFLRVLKPGGRLIVAVPGSNHLLRLREHLLDRPQPDENKAERAISDLTEGFNLVDHTRSNFILQLNRDALDQLIAMTPLGWKSSRARQESLARFDELDVEAAFEILTFSRSTDR